MSEPKEFYLAPAAWAPEGRLVAYEPSMTRPEKGIHVVEKWAYDRMKGIANARHGDLVDRITMAGDENKRLRAALENIKTHQEYIGNHQMSIAWNIASKALSSSQIHLQSEGTNEQ